MNADIKKSFVVKVEQSDTGFYTGLFIDSGNMPFQSPSGNIQAFSNCLKIIFCGDKTAEHLSFSFRERKHFREFSQLFFIAYSIRCICNKLFHKYFLLKGICGSHDADSHKQKQHKNNDGNTAAGG